MLGREGMVGGLDRAAAPGLEESLLKPVTFGARFCDPILPSINGPRGRSQGDFRGRDVDSVVS